MLTSFHGTYTGDLSKGLPHGQGSKQYNSGIHLKGTWDFGIPKGKFQYTYQDLSTYITFKRGLISRIHTEKDQLTIFFPYKYQPSGQEVLEYEDEESKSFYSVLRMNCFNKIFEKPINRKLNQTKKFKFLNRDYFGEFIHENTPHGFGICVTDEFRLYWGEIRYGMRHGRGWMRYGYHEFKGNFRDGHLFGQGIQKDLVMGFKFRGNFESMIRVGRFEIFLGQFKLECNYSHDCIDGCVKYFKNNEFIAEYPADEMSFEPLTDDFSYSELFEFITLTQSNYLIFKDRIKCPFCTSGSSCQSCGGSLKVMKVEKHHNKSKMKNVILPDVKDWIDHEYMLIDYANIAIKKEVNDELRFLKFHGLECFRGLISENDQMKFGKYKYSKDEVYIGEFKGNMRNGLGIINKQGSYRYRGYWNDDKFHGKGEFSNDKYKINGIWNNGILVKVSNVLEYY